MTDQWTGPSQGPSGPRSGEQGPSGPRSGEQGPSGPRSGEQGGSGPQGGYGVPGPPRRLERSATEKMIAGVAGGLGQYFGLDPVIFRIAFVVLALAGGSGALLYALAWALLPRQDQSRSAIQTAMEQPDKAKRVLAAVIVLVGSVALLGQARFPLVDDKLAMLVSLAAIIAAVVWLVSHDGDDHQPIAGQPRPPVPPPPFPPPPPGPAAATGPWAGSTAVAGPTPSPAAPGPEWPSERDGGPEWPSERDGGPELQAPEALVGPVVAGGPDWLAAGAGGDPTEPLGHPESLEVEAPRGADDTAPSLAAGSAPGPWPTDTSVLDVSTPAGGHPVPPLGMGPSGDPGSGPPPDAPGRSVTLVVISVLLVGAGVAALAGVAATVFLSGALVVVGAALLSGRRWGRSRGLIPVGILLVAALGVASAVQLARVPLRGGAGERLSRPIAVTQLQDKYRLGLGSLHVDLSGLVLAGIDGDEDIEIEASVGAGELTVTVPAGVDVVVDARVGLGQLDLLGEQTGGAGVERRVVSRASTVARVPTLELDLEAGMGEVRVVRGAV